MTAHPVEIQKMSNDPHFPRFRARCLFKNCLFVSPPADIDTAKDAKAAHVRATGVAG